MLIIHPPLTKPCEPPAALAYLFSTLKAHNHPCVIIDMNIEGLHFLFETTEPQDDTWSRRAFKGREKNLSALGSTGLYSNIDRYKRAVSDLNRLLENEGHRFDLQLSFGNYVHKRRSPLKSCDLRQAAEQYQDNIFSSWFEKRIAELIALHNPAHIGFSLSYLSQALCTFAMIGFIRARYPEIKIILGGGLVTTWLSNVDWRDPFPDLVDHYVSGQGEGPLLKILGKQREKEYIRPCYKELRRNRYLSPGFILPYASSSGCFWKKCNFCPEKTENSPYSHIPPETTVSDLKTLISKTSPALIHFLDNAISPDTMRALTIDPPGVPWYGFARIDPLLSNRQFCISLKKSGCAMLKLGLESGNQNVLDGMEKGIDLQLASTVLENLHAAGIATYVYLLFGTPAESLTEAEQTLSFVKKHHRFITFLNLAIFNLPRCSMETSHLMVSDFYDGDLSIYRNFIHPKGWNRREVRHFLDTRFKRDKDIAAILRHDPPFFTSNHAPFFS
ncbi:MAG: radical SAM protein [Deltaproteobacteria bacterium]|nr:radical SAM protein [Deltaproteobacteria bacterium]